MDMRRPREVFADAVARIAEALAPAGFRYAPSGARVSRQGGPTSVPSSRCVIHFGSSHYNAPGHVNLGISAHVTSSALKRWRRERDPEATHDWVAGAGLGFAYFPYPRRDWNVAVPGEVDDAIAAIRTVVLPWFEIFEDRRGLARVLREGEVVAMSIERAVEYLLCFEGREAAEQAGNNYLAARPDLLPRFWALVHHFRREGVDVLVGLSEEENLARLAVREGLSIGGPEQADRPQLLAVRLAGDG